MMPRGTEGHLLDRWFLNEANNCALGMGIGSNYYLISRFEIYVMKWAMGMLRDIEVC